MHAFSSAGIAIISKQCNWLKPDIVEALQCSKCLYKNGLIFRDVLLSSTIENDLDGEEILDLDIHADEIVAQGGTSQYLMVMRTMLCRIHSMY